MHSLELNGAWRVRWTDGQRGRIAYAERDEDDAARYIDAAVPGSIYLDALRAGLIEEPAIGMNVLAARWMEQCIWSYRRTFSTPADLGEKTRAWLVFEGLDYAATVVLNGREVGRHANVFYPCRLDVTGKLRADRPNVLTVHLDPGMFHVADKPGEGYYVDHNHPTHKRHWLRKPQSQFSWDWAPRLMNCGIFAPCRLEWTDAEARIDELVPIVEVAPDLSSATVTVRLHVENLTDRALNQTLAASLEFQGKPVAAVDAAVELKPGLHPVEAKLELRDPSLWWPVGHGEQPLYQVKARLGALGEKSARIGMRRVVVNQDKHPTQPGRYFRFEINNRPVFCKGANFVPADLILPRVGVPQYRHLIAEALAANFNFLRVWGGGLYESDEFYDLCDSHGILVWQDFIFACAKYPAADPTFHEEVRREATYNIRRLARHPSLVAWCGNNEIELAGASWEPYQRGQRLPDYGLYHRTLPQLVRREHPGCYYQPSSPWSPDGLPPNADEAGDQHPWTLGFLDNDWRKYRRMICRFPNEGGMLGPTALPTILACLPEKHRHVQSFAWQVHDNSVDGWAESSPPDAAVKTWLGLDARKLSIEQFTYWVGLAQGEGLQEYVHNFRRRMFDSSAAIFWMFNDCWPAVRSWTIVDYYGRRTPAFHPVRRAMNPIHVVVAEEDGKIRVFGINETPKPVTAELRCGIVSLDGSRGIDRQSHAMLPPNASTVLVEWPSEQWQGRDNSLAVASLHAPDGALLARGRLLDQLPVAMQWKKATVRTSLENGRAVFRSDAFAWGVCLDLTGEAPIADNFFDVWPGEPYSIPWTAPTPPRIVHIGNELPAFKSSHGPA